MLHLSFFRYAKKIISFIDTPTESSPDTMTVEAVGWGNQFATNKHAPLVVIAFTAAFILSSLAATVPSYSRAVSLKKEPTASSSEARASETPFVHIEGNIKNLR